MIAINKQTLNKVNNLTAISNLKNRCTRLNIEPWSKKTFDNFIIYTNHSSITKSTFSVDTDKLKNNNYCYSEDKNFMVFKDDIALKKYMRNRVNSLKLLRKLKDNHAKNLLNYSIARDWQFLDVPSNSTIMLPSLIDEEEEQEPEFYDEDDDDEDDDDEDAIF